MHEIEDYNSMGFQTSLTRWKSRQTDCMIWYLTDQAAERGKECWH